HPLAQIGAVDEIVEDLEGQQVGIALRLAADVDQRLVLIMAAEEILAGDGRDQEAERILFPAGRGRGDRRLRSRLVERRTSHVPPSQRPARPYRRARAPGSRYFGALALRVERGLEQAQGRGRGWGGA